MWPQSNTRFHELQSRCTDTCALKPLHQEIIGIISYSGYSKAQEPGLQLLANVAIFKLSDETSDAIRTWIDFKKRCFHRFRAQGGTDIIDMILATGDPSSFKFARWVLSLHENCVERSGHKCKGFGWTDRRFRLWRAIRQRNMRTVEFYLHQSQAALTEEEEKHCEIDFDLLNEIVECSCLPPDFKSQAISIAIPRVAGTQEQEAYIRFKRAIISGNWDFAMALSSRGLSLADIFPSASKERSWFRVLDDVLYCVSQSASPKCTQARVTSENKPISSTIELCVRHMAEAKQAWSKPLPTGQTEDDAWTFESLRNLVYEAEP